MKTFCLYPKFIIPVEPANTVLHDHAIVIENEKITAILPAEHARTQYANLETIELPHHILLPGLVNLHGHSAMSLLRGLADDLALMEWLNQHIWPAEHRHVSDQFVFDGSEYAMAEMLRGGTTTINDMYFHHQAVARAAISSGMRAVVGCSILEFPTPYAANADAYFDHALAALSEFKGESRVMFRLAPHAPYTVSDASFLRAKNLSEEHGIGIHCHLHESLDEITGSLEQYGKRPLQRLHELGVLNSNWVGAHMVHVTSEEIDLLAKTGLHVAHNPASNLKLASGFAPIHALQTAGVNVGLGTDGAASNNQLDMLGDMRLAALLAKATAQDPTALNAHQAIQMATLNGAKALGLDDRVGSIVPGKEADFFALSIDSIECAPIFDPASHVAYAANRSQVTHVWVKGRCVLDERKLKTLDESVLQGKVAAWTEKIRAD